VLGKLGKVDKLVIQVQRVADALERMTGMRLQTLKEDIIPWPESREEETEMVERLNKEKSREVMEEKYDISWIPDQEARQNNVRGHLHSYP